MERHRQGRGGGPRPLRQSLLPHIDGAVIVDTGSTDGTPELLERLFDQAGKPLQLYHSQFTDFAQLTQPRAGCSSRQSTCRWDYLLLADADMELVVDDPDLEQKTKWRASL